jgi:cell division protein FtsQ
VEVREVTVEGTSRLSVEQILAAADVQRGRSLFRLDPETIAARIEALPPVESARVSRDWPHRVVIAVVERRPVAMVMTGTGATLLDRTGVPFATVAQPPEDLVPVAVGAPVDATMRGGAGAADAKAAMGAFSALPQHLQARVERVRAPTPLAVSFELRNGRTVVWGSAEEGPRKVAVLQALLRRKAQVYDVSTPDVAVTR